MAYVLIVEDNEMNRDMLGEGLKEEDLKLSLL